MITVSRIRLHVMRAYYALMAIGTAVVFWPDLLSHSVAFGVQHGAQYALLSALTPFALLGLRYPLQMMPIIFYEFAWKLLWFILVVAPLWAADAMTPGVWSNVFACGIAIVLTPIVVPWKFLLDAIKPSSTSV